MTTILTSTVGAPEREPVPPLENGDRLTRVEFERRYEAMPEGIKAELVEGVVYLMPSPGRIRQHGTPSSTSSGGWASTRRPRRACWAETTPPCGWTWTTSPSRTRC